MPRSFIPQYVAKLHELSEYIAKHRSKMLTYTLTADQIATFNAILDADSKWAGVLYREEP